MATFFSIGMSKSQEKKVNNKCTSSFNLIGETNNIFVTLLCRCMQLEIVKSVPFVDLMKDECSSQLNIRICDMIDMIDMISYVKFSDKKAIVS